MQLGSIREIETLSPDEMSDAELHTVVIEFQRHKAQLAAAEARCIAAWDARKVWADNGSRSPAVRLSADAKIAKPTASRLVRRARRLRTMPLTAEALADGSLSVDHADQLVALNTPELAQLFERDEQVLVDQARQLWPWEYDKALAYWRQCAHDEIGKEDPAAKLHADRYFSATVGYDGGTDVADGSTPSTAPSSAPNSNASNNNSSKPPGRPPAPNTATAPCPNTSLAPPANAGPMPPP